MLLKYLTYASVFNVGAANGIAGPAPRSLPFPASAASEAVPYGVDASSML